MANRPVWHDIFRYVKLMPDNVTLEADTYKDTLNIVRGQGVSFGSMNTSTDTFEINVNYDISVPVATTKISLEDVNGNLSEVTLKAGRGVAIIRNSAQELEFESYAVTETDTLQTVTERNNITNNKIFVNDIEVGTISSSFTEDGFPSYDAGHNLIGDGTLDNPLKFSPLYQDSLSASNTDQFTFTAVGPGTLAYSASYVFDALTTSGSVSIEREDPFNPGTWVILDIQTGSTIGISYAIQGTYAEIYSGNVNYRLTYAWAGNTGVATWHVLSTFEGGAYTPINNPQLKTDTTTKTVDINDLQFFQNNIRTTVSNTDIVLDPAGTGKVVALSDITAPTFTGDLTGNVNGNVIGDLTGNVISTNTSLTVLDTSGATAIFTGNVTGNADTVTNGVYTTVSYSNPSWITSLDASKIVGSIQLSDITIDGDLRLFDNVITTSQSNSDIVLDPNGTGKVRAFSNIVAPGFEGNLTGNADTVTNGVYTSGSYSNPSWITSLDGTKVTSAVLTTGSYADPSWITSLDAAKIIGDIQLRSFIIDDSIRIDGNLIESIVSNANLELRASGTGVVYISDSLTVTDAITFNTTTNNQSYTTTGAGTITITSGTTGNINNMNIGVSTASAGNFTSIGSTTTGSGAFTTLTANSTTKVQQIKEKVISGTAPAATETISLLSGAVYRYANNNANDWILNFIGDGSTTMDTFLSTDESTTVTLITKNTGTAYKNTSVQVDGTTVNVTVVWLNASSYPAGNTNSTDVYTYTIIKTAASIYTVIASQTRYG